MRYINIYLNIIICCILMDLILSSAINTVSYIENINFSYDNDRWICGGIECPSNTFGCRIQRHTDSGNKTLVHSVYTCFDENTVNIMSVNATNEMINPRIIDIDIESYKGAVSLYSTGYGLGGHENANGVISPDSWVQLIQNAQDNRRVVEESNA